MIETGQLTVSEAPTQPTSMPVSTIPLPFFRCRFAVPVSQCRFRTPLPLPLRIFLLFMAETERNFLT